MKKTDFKLSGSSVIQILKDKELLIDTISDFESLNFCALTFNSKEVSQDCLFICKGRTFRSLYLEDAKQRGAIAYVSEKKYDEVMPCVIVRNIQRAMGLIAKAYYRYEPSDFNLIGVTGTKGKSTTVYFIKNAIAAAMGREPAYLTTVDQFDGNEYKEAKLTTPESPTTYALFAQAKENGCHHVVMELSSQSDKVERLVGMTYQYGVFINISDDHIAPNEHADFSEYLQCKMNIVARYQHAVINLDDPHSKDAIAAAKNAKQILTYSLHQDSTADIRAKDIERNGRNTAFTVVTPTWEQRMCMTIPGVYNVSNALAACGIGWLMGLDSEMMAQGVEKTRVDGRMEIYEHRGYLAVVDYAHNKASIHAAYQALRDYYPDRKIVAVFGCPGDKAFQRRKDMAEESAGFCDHIIITSEDPGHADPMGLCKEVQGYAEAFGLRSEIIPDRAQAVKTAIEKLEKDEILIIAGKGSEHYQVVGSIAEPYEGDTVLVQKYIMKK